MGVSCQILINKTRSGYRPGQQVTGIVKYALDQPLEVKSAVLSLSGKGKCKWYETRTVNKMTETVSYTGYEEYFIASLNVIEKKHEDVITIPEGCYEFPFEFYLPQNIPSSYKDDIGHITYKLSLKFKRPGVFRFNKKFSTEVPVSSCIDDEGNGPVVSEIQKTLTKLFSKRKHNVNVKIDVDKTALTPGDKALLSLVVMNDTSVTITAIKTELIRRLTYTADCGRTKTSEKILKECTVKSTSIPNDAIVNLRQEISTLPDMVSINSRVINVEFQLKVTVKLPMPHLNASVEIPVVIGEKLEVVEDDPPPPYWEVMKEEEKVKE